MININTHIWETIGSNNCVTTHVIQLQKMKKQKMSNTVDLILQKWQERSVQYATSSLGQSEQVYQQTQWMWT